jgi:hypothetical protein
MTDSWELPSELRQIEQDLIARSRSRAVEDLRPRILGDLRSRLRAERLRAHWQFALAVAVVVLVWLNLSISATQATDCGLRLHGPSGPIQTVADEIHRLVPDLSPEESRRQAVLLQAGSHLVCAPRMSTCAATCGPMLRSGLLCPVD